MPCIMSTPDIAHLAHLARIELQPGETESLQEEIAAIVGYVSDIQSLAATETETKQLTPRYNVFRSDEVTNEPGAYTERLLAAAPETERGYVVVKKILSQDDSK